MSSSASRTTSSGPTSAPSTRATAPRCRGAARASTRRSETLARCSRRSSPCSATSPASAPSWTTSSGSWAAPRHRSHRSRTPTPQLFKNFGITFEALSRDPESLRDTIEGLRPTLDVGIDSFKVQRPFLRDTAELSRRLRPVAVEIERSLPLVADAFEVGAPVQARVPTLYRNTEKVFKALDVLASNPSTLDGPARPASHPGGGHAAGGVRGALPDGLQLRHVLAHRPVGARVRGRAGHRPAQRVEVGQQHAGQPREHHRRRPPRRRARGHEPKDRHRPHGRRSAGAARRRLRETPSTPRATPTARWASAATRPGRAFRTGGTHARPTPRRAAAATWCWACLPRCPAAPTSRVSWGSTTSRTCPDDQLHRDHLGGPAAQGPDAPRPPV